MVFTIADGLYVHLVAESTLKRESGSSLAPDVPESPSKGRQKKNAAHKNQAIIPGAVPPGLSLPSDFPPLAAPSRAPATLTSLQSSMRTQVAAPFPLVPAVPIVTSQQPIGAPALSKDGGSPASGEIGNAPNFAESDTVQPVDEPSTASRQAPKSTKKPSESGPLTQAEIASKEATPPNGDDPVQDSNRTAENNKSGEKRQRPGKLDIAAAKDSTKRDIDSLGSSNDQARPATPSKAAKKAAIALSQPSTPATAVSQSSASSVPRQVQPRTLRVVPTPKSETPPRIPVGVSTGPVAFVNKQVSRQASLSSINQPGTPVNEIASDNASMTSTSVSRPGSPPGGKVGSAPVRQTTKSQQKKERQARAKRLEESKQSEDVKSIDSLEEPIQAPIIGRKKKAKKPTQSATMEPQTTGKAQEAAVRAEDTEPKNPQGEKTVSAKDVKKQAPEFKKQAKKETVASPTEEDVVDSPVADAPETSEKLRKSLLTAATLFADLQKAGSIAANALDLFKNVSGINYRFDLTEADVGETNTLPTLSDGQRSVLEQGRGVIVETGENKRVVVLPDRRTLRGFSREQAQRYLDLREQTLASKGVMAFNSTRHNIERWLHAAPPPIANMEGIPMESQFGLSGDGSTISNETSELMNHFASPMMSGAIASSNYWAAVAATGVPLDEGVPMRIATMSVEEAEKAMIEARKETEALEKRLNGIIKKNRRLLVGSAH